jgi:hypothetical protein
MIIWTEYAPSLRSYPSGELNATSTRAFLSRGNVLSFSMYLASFGILKAQSLGAHRHHVSEAVMTREG